MSVVRSAAQAATMIPDGATVMVDGSGGGVNEPTVVLRAIEERYLRGDGPHNLTVMHISGVGDGDGGGIDRFAHRGMTRRVIGGHWGWSPRMQTLAAENAIEAYCLPQGVLSHLMRETAARRPGLVTKVGIATFVDPRVDGGRLNEAARDDLVDVVSLAGDEFLFYRSIPVDVALIRGSVADERGNITMDDEGLFAETLSTAQAAKNSGGVVIAQVRELVAAGSLDPRRVKVPGILVDAVVVDPNQRLSVATLADPALTGASRRRDRVPSPSRIPFDVRKVIARRAAGELRESDVVNLGFGMPDGVAAVLDEEGLSEAVTFTIEQGHVGGVPAGGTDFGLARYPEASIDAGYQFDWIDGGGIDIAVLSFAQVDAAGNVNVGRFGSRAPGVGGFVNISQGARRVVFVGTFVAGHDPYEISDGRIKVPAAGAAKFVQKVEQISFAASTANGKPVHYVTERAVFELTPDGPVLTEIAPGVDLKADVLAHMGFVPRVSPNLRVMNPSLFTDSLLSLQLRVPSKVR